MQVFPQFGKFDAKYNDFDRFYDFIYGSRIAQRNPSPSVRVLMIAERKAWKEIALLMHKGTGLKESMESITRDSLFWQTEVYERVGNWQTAASGADWSPTTPIRRNRGGKGNQNTLIWSPPAPARGKSKGKGKTSKGKPGSGKGQKQGQGKTQQRPYAAQPQQKTTWAQNWAQVDPKGKQFRRNFFLQTCGGSCGRSHQCPVIKKDGMVCNSNHHPSGCPNA